MYMQEKVVHKLNQLKTQSFSIELVPYLPHESDPLDIVARLSSSPLFVSISWHAKRNPPLSKTSATLDLAKAIVERIKPSPTVLVNLACIGQTKASIKCILDELISLGICNVFVIRGEPPRDTSTSDCAIMEGDFVYASQLISFIKSYAGDYFCIGVPGYPERSAPHDWQCISEKVALGADFIITQIFLEPSSYFNYVHKCRSLDIKVPILPGIMPILSCQSINLIRRLTKSPIPLKVQSMMVKLQGDSSAISDYGMSYTRDICFSISSLTNLLHFFALNKEEHLFKLLHSLKLLK